MKYTINAHNVNHAEFESQALATMFACNGVPPNRVSMNEGIDFDTKARTVKFFVYKHNNEGNVVHDFISGQPKGEWQTLTPAPETWEF